jgi:hypothetical protein
MNKSILVAALLAVALTACGRSRKPRLLPRLRPQLLPLLLLKPPRLLKPLLRLLPPPLPRPPLLLPRLPLLLKLPSRLKPLLLMLPSPQWMLARPLLKPARAQWTLARPLLKPPRSNISCFNKNGASAPFFYCSDLIVRFVLSHVTPVKSLIRSGYTYPVKRASQRTRRCANGQFGQIVALAQMGDNQMLQDEQSI